MSKSNKGLSFPGHFSKSIITASTMTVHFSFLPLFQTLTKVPAVQWDITEGLSLSSIKVRPVGTGIFTGYNLLMNSDPCSLCFREYSCVRQNRVPIFSNIHSYYSDFGVTWTGHYFLPLRQLTEIHSCTVRYTVSRFLPLLVGV